MTPDSETENAAPVTPGGSNSATAGAPSQPRYIDLSGSFPTYTDWSNDPKDMNLEIYFSQDPSVPTLSNEFGIKFKPVLVKRNTSCGISYLLTDDKKWYYLWDEMSGDMWRFKDLKLELNTAVYKTLSETFQFTELERQFSGPNRR